MKHWLQSGCSAILLSLLVWMVVPGEVWAQEEPFEGKYKLSAFYGACFGTAESTEVCPFYGVSFQFPFPFLGDLGRRGFRLRRVGSGQAEYAAMSAPFRRRRVGRGGADGALSVYSASRNVHHEPPDAARFQPAAKQTGVDQESPELQPDEAESGLLTGTNAVVLDLLFPFAVRDRMLVEPFAGGGLGWLDDATVRHYRGGRYVSYRLEKEGTWPTLNYGVKLSARLLPQVDLQAQYRRIVYLPGQMTYVEFESEVERDVEVGSVVVGSLTFGLAVRFGS